MRDGGAFIYPTRPTPMRTARPFGAAPQSGACSPVNPFAESPQCDCRDSISYVTLGLKKGDLGTCYVPRLYPAKNAHKLSNNYNAFAIYYSYAREEGS